MAGIYIHIPFCKQACYYCDFHFSTSIKRKGEMVNAICDEIVLRKNESEESIETIYFGGGTPSLLSKEEIEQILKVLYKNFKVVENPEISLEANPDDLTESKIEELAKSPINRLSIGIQSFFEDDLKSMNRAHTAAESIDCLYLATRHFTNITVDLIYGVPNMSAYKWKQNLQKVFDLGINHISSYALTVEPKTALDTFIEKGTYPPLDEELAAQHFDILVNETTKHGFIHYETSNFGKEGFFSKHNTSYWHGKQYLGVGPSAHSFNGKERSWNIANNAKYIKELEKNQLPSEKELLAVNDIFNEIVMTGLRTVWGVDLEKIEIKFGEEYKEYLIDATLVFINKGLLVIENKVKKSVSNKQLTSSPTPRNDGILKTTEKGKFLADGIASDLFIL